MSQTGKSALIDIVDYITARNHCHVADGVIRETVAWYAALFDLNGASIFIARRNPASGQRTSGDVYLSRESGSSLPPLTDLVKNTTTDALESFLTAAIGISENQVRPETSPSGLLRAQFRHALFYSFQDQNDIDSKRNLFHRQDQDYVGRDIRDTLPYFLGAMDEDALTKQAELQQARRRLRQLERELRTAQSPGSLAGPRAQALVDEAKQVGLVDERTTTATEERTLSVLHALAADSTIRDQEIVEDGEDLLAALRSERQGLRMEFERINAEIRSTRMFASESSAYAREAREQRARLSAVGLIDNGTAESDHCPVCSSLLDIPPPSVRQLQESLRALDDELDAVQSENPRVQMRLAQLLSEQTELRQRLRENQRRISARIQENEILRVQRDNFILQARTIGKVQQYLEAADLVDDNAALRRSVDAQRDRIAVLEQDLDPEVIRDAITAYCNIIGSYMTAYSDGLGLEHGGSQLRLDARNLTVVADTDSGPVPLGQMGSGENWVGYHVLAHLGLHKWFRRRNRPVPGFLFFDQPSQAHYPSSETRKGRSQIYPTRTKRRSAACSASFSMSPKNSKLISKSSSWTMWTSPNTGSKRRCCPALARGAPNSFQSIGSPSLSTPMDYSPLPDTSTDNSVARFGHFDSSQRFGRYVQLLSAVRRQPIRSAFPPWSCVSTRQHSHASQRTAQSLPPE